MKVYIGNADESEVAFSYWSSTAQANYHMRLGPMSQIELPDITQADLDNMIGQYMNHGFVQASSHNFTGTGLCYEIDNPIPNLTIA